MLDTLRKFIGDNRPIDIAIYLAAIAAALAIVAVATYVFMRSGRGDSISGRINRWLWREHPLTVALFGACVAFPAGLIVGVLLTHWLGWSASG